MKDIKDMKQKFFYIVIALLLNVFNNYAQNINYIYIERNKELEEQFITAIKQIQKQNNKPLLKLYTKILSKPKDISMPLIIPNSKYLIKIENILNKFSTNDLKAIKNTENKKYIKKIYKQYSQILISIVQSKKYRSSLQKNGLSGINNYINSYTSSGHYIGIREYIRKLNFLSQHKFEIKKLCKKEYDEALQKKRITKLWKIIEEFSSKEYTKKALILLGDIYFSRGKFDLAIGLWSRLKNLGIKLSKKEALKLNIRIAVVSFLYGDLQKFIAIKKNTNDNIIQIGPKTTTAKKFLEDLENIQTDSPVSPDTWTSYRGNNSNNFIQEGIDLSDKKFEHIFCYIPLQKSRLEEAKLQRARLRSYKHSLHYMHYPLLWKNYFYFLLQNKLVCLNQILYKEWEYKFPGKIKNNDKKLIAGTISNGYLYICSQNTKFNKLYCFNAKNGKKIWSWPKNNTNIIFNQPPVIINNKIFATGDVLTGQTNTKIFCLNNKGKLEWETFIGSILIESSKKNAQKTTSSEITGGYGLAYCCTNFGIIAAVDINNGEIRWVNNYHKHQSKKYRIYNKVNHKKNKYVEPIVKHGKLYVIPSDINQLFVYDAINGHLLKIFPQHYKHSEFIKILGVCKNGNIFLGCQDKIVCLQDNTKNEILWELNIQKILWDRNFQQTLINQSIFTSKWIYVPTTDFILQINLSNGRYKKVFHLNKIKYLSKNKKLYTLKNKTLLLFTQNNKAHLLISGDKIHKFSIEKN